MTILTTHVGSLPRPPSLLPFIRGDAAPPPNFAEMMARSTEAVLKRQVEAGLHCVNDGELGRRDYVTAARKRLTGFDTEKEAVGAGDLEEMTEYSDKFEGRKGLLSLTKKTEVKNPGLSTRTPARTRALFAAHLLDAHLPICSTRTRILIACSGPITFTAEGRADLEAEIERVVAAAKAASLPLDRVFFSSPSPGTLATFFDDDYYHDHSKYVAALGAAMKTEYEMIAAAGLCLQVDCPDLAMGRHTRFKALSLAEFQKAARVNVEVMNAAVASIPPESMRMHVCWGNYPGPHHHDVPLAEIISIVLEAKPKYLSIEACNPGHGHEWEVFKDVALPADKVLMPGVLDTTTSHIEHPRLIAQRLMNYVRLVGADRVMACTDCGFSTAAGALNVPTDIVYAKLAAMVKGAAIADEMAEAQAIAEEITASAQPAKKRPKASAG